MFWQQIKPEKKTIPVFGTTVFLRSLKEQNDLKLFQIGAILSKNKKKDESFRRRHVEAIKKKFQKKKQSKSFSHTHRTFLLFFYKRFSSKKKHKKYKFTIDRYRSGTVL